MNSWVNKKETDTKITLEKKPLNFTFDNFDKKLKRWTLQTGIQYLILKNVLPLLCCVSPLYKTFQWKQENMTDLEFCCICVKTHTRIQKELSFQTFGTMHSVTEKTPVLEVWLNCVYTLSQAFKWNKRFKYRIEK